MGGEAVSYHGRSCTPCGYCASSSSSHASGSVSDGALAHAIAPSTYDGLINRGWRRSGRWMYKPTIGVTCCAPYTIRLRCDAFVRSKSQRKVERRFSRTVAGARGDAADADEADEADEARMYTCTTARSSFVEEEFALWKKYQVAVHGDSEDELRRSSYEGFLVDSPLIEVPPGAGTPSVGYGAFHQQYRIDGELIAVGVIDVLPTGLSSKYFFWDPAYAHLSLGKLSALKEIEWVLDEAKKSKSPEFAYYYMGFYIHGCQKMRYKAEYNPSEILCPVTHRWVKVNDADVRRRLDAGKTRLTDEDVVELDRCDPCDALVGLAYAGKLMQCTRLGDLPKMMSQWTFIDVSNTKLAAFLEIMHEFCERFLGAAKHVMNLVDIAHEFCESDDEDEGADVFEDDDDGFDDDADGQRGGIVE